MNPGATLNGDGATVTVHVPIAFRKRGGRKLVTAPDGAEAWPPLRPRIDNTLLHAVVLAFRWKQLLNEGAFATVSELAAAEKLNVSYVAHILRLTLLSPALIEAILDGTQPRTIQLQPMMRSLPLTWAEQM